MNPQQSVEPPLYMVDTCSFTEMRRTYPRGPFPQVWELMDQLIEEGRLLSIELVLDELNVFDDEIAQWAQARGQIFLPLDAFIQREARQILESHPNLVDLKKKKSSADPFLVAAAITRQAIVVTQEKPSGGPPAIKIPNVCHDLGIPCIALLELISREMA